MAAFYNSIACVLKESMTMKQVLLKKIIRGYIQDYVRRGVFNRFAIFSLIMFLSITSLKADHFWYVNSLTIVENPVGSGIYQIDYTFTVSGATVKRFYWELFVVESGCSFNDGFTEEFTGCTLLGDLPNGDHAGTLATGIRLCPGKTYDAILYTRRRGDCRSDNTNGSGGSNPASCNANVCSDATCGCPEDRAGAATPLGLLTKHPGIAGGDPANIWAGAPLNTLGDTPSFDGNWAYLRTTLTGNGLPDYNISFDIEFDDCFGDFDVSAAFDETDGQVIDEDLGSASVRCGVPIFVTYNAANNCGVGFPGNTFEIVDNSTIGSNDLGSNNFNLPMGTDINVDGRFESFTNAQAIGKVCQDGILSLNMINAPCSAEMTTDATVSVDVEVRYPTSNFATPTRVNCSDMCGQDLVLTGSPQWNTTGVNMGASTTLEIEDFPDNFYSFDWSGQICTPMISADDCDEGLGMVMIDNCASCGVYDITYEIVNDSCGTCSTTTTKQVQIVSPVITNVSANITMCGLITPVITFDVVECNPATGAATATPYTGVGEMMLERSDNPGVFVPVANPGDVMPSETVMFTPHWIFDDCASCNAVGPPVTVTSIGLLEVMCPADLDLGTFDCSNLATIPPPPTTQAAAAAAPYNIEFGTDPCGTIIVMSADDAVPDPCTLADQIITRTITVIDDQDGNGVQNDMEMMAECVYTFTIVDAFVSPALVGMPTDEDITCDVPPVATTLAFTNNGTNACLSQGMVTSTLTAYPGICGGEVTETWTIPSSDNCDRGDIVTSRTITILPPDPPVITCPANATVECAADIVVGVATATTSCGAMVTITNTMPTLATGDADCPGATYEITYTAEDECGGIVMCTQIFTIANDPPMITAPADAVVECADDIMQGTPTTVISCTLGATVSPVGPTLVSGMADCPGATYEIVYTVTDDCDREAVDTQTFTIANDPPTIDCPENEIVECFTDIAVGTPTITSSCMLETNLATVGPTLVSGDADCPGAIYQITYTVTDDCGREVTCNQTFTIANDPPVITPPVNMTVTCFADIAAGTATATSSCTLGLTSITSTTATLTGGVDLCDGATYEIVYSVTDDCGRTAMATQIFTLSNMGPAITACPADEDVVCMDDIMANAAGVVFTTDCGLGATVTPGAITPGAANSACGELNGDTYTITYTVVDDCGRMTSCDQTFSITSSPPTITCLPNITVIGCDASDAPAPDPSLITGTDQCNMITASFVMDTETGTGCPGDPLVISRTYRVTNECDVSTDCTQLITILDDIQPSITIDVPVVNVSCEEMPPLPVVTVTDNCTSVADITIDFSQDTLTVICPGNFMIQRTWIATDECGNMDTVTQDVGVFDMTTPTFLNVPADTTISCIDMVPPAVDPEVDENCNVQMPELLETTVPGACPGELIITRTFSVEDSCMNMVSFTQTIMVIDTIPPTITCPAAESIIGCDAADAPAPDITAVTAADQCSDVTVTHEGDVASGSGCPGDPLVIMRTYRATDECGNFTECTQVISIMDNVPPDMITCPADIVVIGCGVTDAPAPDISLVMATDNCSTPVISFIQDTPVGTVCPGDTLVITRLYRATDACGNTTDCMQLIRIVDNISPVITSCPADMTISCLADVPPAAPEDVSATDNCGLPMTATTLTTTENGGSGCVGDPFIITYTYQVLDACDNATTCMQTITVIDDAAPVITAFPADVTVMCPSEVPAPDATAIVSTDNCGVASTMLINTEDTSSPDCSVNPYTVSYTYEVLDACGNSDTHIQTITVNDITPPVLSATPANITVTCFADVPGDQGITATDNCANVGEVMFMQSTPGTCSGDDTIMNTWTVEDCVGLITTYTQIVTVDNNMAPVLSEMPADINVMCLADVPGDPGVTATDNCGEDLIVTFTQSAPGACPGNDMITNTWTVTDCAGNPTTHVQTITIEDTTPPVLSPQPGDLVVMCQSDVPGDPGVTAIDNCGEMLTVSFMQSPLDPCVGSGTITNTWIVTDCAGNMATHTQTIIVDDTTPPVLSAMPGDLTVSCHADIPGDPGVTATDNCGETVMVSFNQSPLGVCPGSDVITNIWTVTDCAGNVTSHTQTVTVEDTSDPILSALPGDLMVVCRVDVPGDPGITATDNCGEVLTVVYVQSSPGPCEGNDVITNTWTVMDCAGNDTTHVQTITILDGIAPIAPADESTTVNCLLNAIVPPTPPSVVDNCGSTISPTGPVEGPDPVCVGAGTKTFTWTYTDCAGNVDTYTFTYTIIDITRPDFNVTPADVTLNCEDAIPFTPTVVGLDICEGTLPVTFTEVIEGDMDDCPNDFTITRTWTVEDCAGNMNSQTQVITVVDIEAPTITCPADVTIIGCDISAAPPVDISTVTASDNCGDPTVTFVSDVVTGEGCLGDTLMITRTYRATDACGQSTDCVQLIKIVDDIPPVVTGIADLTVDCNADVIGLFAAWIASNGGGTATDNCMDVVWTTIPAVPVLTTMTGETCITFVASDRCGNQTSQEACFNINCSSIIKEFVLNQDGDGSMDLSDGDILEYRITYTNEGSTDLTNVTVIDNLITPSSMSCAVLAPGASCVLEGTYTVTAADILAGMVMNVATGDSDETTPIDDDITLPVPTSLIDITKQAPTLLTDNDGSGDMSAGDVIEYTIIVTNTGDANLTNVVVNDPLLTPPSMTCPLLGPSQQCILTGTYIIQSSDLMAGSIENIASGNSTQTSEVMDTVEIDLPLPALTIVKTPPINGDQDISNDVSLGDILTYTITATNTGTATLTNVNITDNLITQVGGTSPCAVVLPGEVCTFIGEYEITLADIDLGEIQQITNVASVSSDQTSEVADSTTIAVPNPNLEIDKSAGVLSGDLDGSGDISLFDEITYTIVIANTGNANLVGIRIVDPFLTPSIATCDLIAPGETCTLVGVHIVTADDLANGSFTNSAIGTSTIPPLEMMDTSAITIPSPSHSMSKSPPILLTDSDGSMDISAGDELQYTITVVNTGTANLTNVVITDLLLTPSTNTCPLVPVGESCELVGTYIVQPSDLGGNIENTAFSRTDQTDQQMDMNDQFVPFPNMEIEKTEGVLLEDNDGNNIISTGDILEYQITITNIGTANLTNVTITDTLITPSSATCAFIAPLETCTLIGTYTVTQADMDLGMITNMADGTSDQAPPVSDTIITITPFVPDLSVDKSVAGLGVLAGTNIDLVDPLDTIFYEFIATNTGLVTMTNIAINDAGPTFGGFTGTNTLSTIACPVTDLLPGETTTCTAYYIISQVDFDNSVGLTDGVVNEATSRGSDPRDDIFESDIDIATDSVPADPGIELLKQAGDIVDTNGDGILWVGDETVYSFTVTNTGNTILNDIVITDPLITEPIQCPMTTLLPGQSMVCTAVYVLTIEDGENGSVFNEASVAAEDQTGISVDDDSNAVLEIPCPSLTCRSNINVSIPPGQEVELTPETVGLPAGFILVLRDENGDIIPENFVDCSLTNVSIIYEVSHPCSPAVCWGNLNIEAKGQPEPTGSFVELTCGHDLPDFPTIPELQDDIANRGCFGRLENFSETTDIEGDGCDGQTLIRTIRADYSVDDTKLNILIHADTIVYIPLELEEVLCPQGEDFDDALEIDCELAALYNELTPEVIFEITKDVTKAFPYIDPDKVISESDTFVVIDRINDVLTDTTLLVDGVWISTEIVTKDTIYRDSIVTIETPVFVPIRPGTTCNLSVEFYDEVFEGCLGPETKIRRSWQLLDWCTGALDTCTQWIIITDDEAQEVDDIDDILVAAAPWTCEASLTLTLPEISDNCSDWTYFWSSNAGRIEGAVLSGLSLHARAAEVTLTVIDVCDNITTETFQVTVVDSSAPVAISPDLLKVTLARDPVEGGGQAQIFAEDLNQESHDSNCGDLSFCTLLDEELQNPIIRDGVHLTDEEGRLLYMALQCEIDGTLEFTSVEDKTTVVEMIPYVVCKEVVKFCCGDVGEHRVALIVSDGSPYSPDGVSWSIVNVEDKSRPVVICEDIEVACEDDIDPDVIGYPDVFDAVCDNGELTFSDEGEVDGCGDGVILRSWYVDGLLECIQRISISNESAFDPYTIKWPKHFDGEIFTGVRRECELWVDDDGDPVLDSNGREQNRIVEFPEDIPMGAPYTCQIDEDLDEPVWCAEACNIIAASFEPVELAANDACKKIVRQWTIIDWCTWVENSADVDDENDTETDQFQAVNDEWLDADDEMQAGTWLSSFRERSEVPIINGSDGSLVTNLPCESCAKTNQQADAIYFRYTTVEEDGFYTFDQVITVIDETPPEIEVASVLSIEIEGGATSKDDNFDLCEASGTITAVASDMCESITVSDQDFIWTVRVLSEAGSQIGSPVTLHGDTVRFDPGFGTAGEQRVVIWSLQDGCNNFTTANTTVRYEDTKAPTPICIQSLSTATMRNTGTTVIWARDYDIGSFDNCGPVDLMFREADGSFVQALDFSCADIPDGISETVTLELYAIDEAGNFDFCNVTIRLDDNLDACTDSNVASAAIAGQIFTPEGMMIPDVVVQANQNKQTLSDEEGSYAFANLPMSRDYLLAGDKHGDTEAGLTSIDLVLLQRHLLGNQEITDPYKLIAADVNMDERVSTLDLVEIRRLILNQSQEFSSGRSWVFIDDDYQFGNPRTPWPFTEGVLITDLSQDMMSEDLMGIKLGDINGSFSEDLTEKDGRRTIVFHVRDISLTEGEITNVTLSSDTEISLSAVHLDFELEGVRLISKADEQPNVSHITSDLQYLAYTGSAKENLQDLTFQVEASFTGRLSQALQLVSQNRTVAYDQKGEEYDIYLMYEDLDQTHASLYQNVPNPFKQNTNVGFYVPYSGDVSIEFYDVTGKMIRNIESYYETGYHEIMMTHDQFSGAGVISYKMIFEETTITKNMVLLR